MMEPNWKKRLCGWICALVTGAVLLCPPVQGLAKLPDEIRLTAGRGAVVRLSPLTRARLASVSEDLSQHLDEVTIPPQQEGSSTLTLRLLGLIPIKQVSLRAEEARTLIPGGQAIGVALRTQGVVAVGTSDLGGSVPSPARLAGLRSGDVITHANGQALHSARELTGLTEEGGELTLTVLRGDETLTLALTPARDPRDGALRLGLWVRDSTAGVGTLSYYDPSDGGFGALGHAITDQDTGVILPLMEGEILQSRVEGVHPGRAGSPGELVSTLNLSAPPLGSIGENNSLGIYGTAYDALSSPLYPQGLPILHKGEVHPGPAQILSTVDAQGVRAFDAQILRVEAGARPQRSLVVRITDPELLALTGGIVQGMSGSPILQDGCLAGAVTHVLVNDPTTGYGIFIEDMLDAAA